MSLSPRYSIWRKRLKSMSFLVAKTMYFLNLTYFLPILISDLGSANESYSLIVLIIILVFFILSEYIYQLNIRRENTFSTDGYLGSLISKLTKSGQILDKAAITLSMDPIYLSFKSLTAAHMLASVCK